MSWLNLEDRGVPDVDKKSYITLLLLFLTVCGLLAAGGCQTRTESRPIQALSPSIGPSGPAASSAVLEPIQSLPEAEMVQFFYFLLEMDAKPKTSLTKTQAEAVLPLVRLNVEKGTMDDEDKKAILHMFGDEQMAFYTRWANRGAVPDAGKPPGNRQDGGLTEEEWLKWKQEWMHRKDDAGPERPSPGATIAPGVQTSPDPNSIDPEGWTAGEKSVEQLLLERLEEIINL